MFGCTASLRGPSPGGGVRAPASCRLRSGGTALRSIRSAVPRAETPIARLRSFVRTGRPRNRASRASGAAVRSVADGRPVSDVDDRFVLRAVDPDPGGIDSVAYRMVLAQRNVGRREAERPSEPVASRDFAFDERIHRFSDSCRALELLPGRVLDRPGASGGACAFLLGNIFYFCSAKVGRIIRIPEYSARIISGAGGRDCAKVGIPVCFLYLAAESYYSE